LRKQVQGKTKAGFEASLYGPTSKTYLALLLDLVSFEGLLDVLDEAAANQFIAAIVGAIGQKSQQNWLKSKFLIPQPSNRNQGKQDGR